MLRKSLITTALATLAALLLAPAAATASEVGGRGATIDEATPRSMEEARNQAVRPFLGAPTRARALLQRKIRAARPWLSRDEAGAEADRILDAVSAAIVSGDDVDLYACNNGTTCEAQCYWHECTCVNACGLLYKWGTANGDFNDYYMCTTSCYEDRYDCVDTCY